MNLLLEMLGIVLLMVYRSNQDNECEKNFSKYLKYEQNKNSTWSIFSNFKSFSQLKPLNCNFFYNITNRIEFIPNTKILLVKKI